MVDGSRRPADVTYGDASPHYAGLLREHSVLGSDSYFVMLGRDPGFGYAHRIELDAALESHTLIELLDEGGRQEEVRRMLGGQEFLQTVR